MPKYEFDVFDVIYLGEGIIRIKAKVNDKSLRELLNQGVIGISLPSDRPLWKVELKTKKKLVMKKQRHNCPKKYYRVVVRKGNYSSFEEPRGEFHPSDWSLLVCLRCRHHWRSKGEYVDTIPDLRPENGFDGTGITETIGLYSIEVEE